MLQSLIPFQSATFELLTRCDSGDAVKASVLFVCTQDEESVLHWQTRLNVAQGTANGILYLHTAFEKPLIHRDVKSANVLLDQQLVPKVCWHSIIICLSVVATPVEGNPEFKTAHHWTCLQCLWSCSIDFIPVLKIETYCYTPVILCVIASQIVLF